MRVLGKGVGHYLTKNGCNRRVGPLKGPLMYIWPKVGGPVSRGAHYIYLDVSVPSDTSF